MKKWTVWQTNKDANPRDYFGFVRISEVLRDYQRLAKLFQQIYLLLARPSFRIAVGLVGEWFIAFRNLKHSCGSLTLAHS